MAKRIFTSAGITWTPTAPGSAIGTPGTASWMALKGAATTQITDILEVMISGTASASTIGGMYLARASTLETTPTTLPVPHSDAPLHFGTGALSAPVVAFVTAATGPTPSNSATEAKLMLGLNLFGGIVRWNAAPTQQWTMVGSTASGGESVLFNSTVGTGAAGTANAHIIYETA
jgi:hypothetical protein